VQLLDFVGDGLELGALGTVDQVVEVVADHGPVRGDDHDLQLVDLEELLASVAAVPVMPASLS